MQYVAMHTNILHFTTLNIYDSEVLYNKVYTLYYRDLLKNSQ